jgi:hypothetical protein
LRRYGAGWMARTGSVVLVGTAGWSCEGVLGIEDAELDPLLGQGGGAPAVCETYCETVAASCAGEDAVYINRDTCLAFCSHLPEGQPGDAVGDTVYCRLSQAQLAAATGEPRVHCPLAGPGGGDTCGENCESYCVVFEQVCSARFEQSYAGPSDCISQCRSDLVDIGDYDVSMQSGDTLQCRLWHLSADWAPAADELPRARLRLAACFGMLALARGSGRGKTSCCSALLCSGRAGGNGRLLEDVGRRRLSGFGERAGLPRLLPAGRSEGGHLGRQRVRLPDRPVRRAPTLLHFERAEVARPAPWLAALVGR